jgi:aromatic-L-amino-acid decarboxylase
LRLDGVAGIQDMIRHHVEMTQRLAAAVAADDRFEVVAPHPLNLLCLRLRSGDADTDALIERANATGELLVTRTVLDGAVALRISIGARATEWRHVAAAWSLLQDLA